MWEKRAAQTLVQGDTRTGNTRYWNYLEDYWPCAGEFLAVNAIGTQLRNPENSGLARWRLTVYGDAVVQSRENPVSTPKFGLSVSNDWADVGRDAVSVTRDQILRRERGQRKTHFFCSGNHEQGWHSYVSADNTICSRSVCDGGRGCGKEVR